jgi:hypothetical protein
MAKDKRLQIRVTDEELAGIQRRAKAKGLSVAEYGRSRLLFGDDTVLTEQVSLSLEDPILIPEEITESDRRPKTDDGPNYAASDDDNDDFLESITEHMTKAIENPGEVSARVEGPTISQEDYKRIIEECEVKDLPPGVRCIKCGFVHGP